MKKLLLLLIFVLLAACTVSPKRVEYEESDRYITNRRGYLLAEICDPANAPRYPRRPKKPKTSEIRLLTEKEMDARIQRYIQDMDEHADKLEDAITRLRQLNEICR